jgi:hypothetical protein
MPSEIIASTTEAKRPATGVVRIGIPGLTIACHAIPSTGRNAMPLTDIQRRMSREDGFNRQVTDARGGDRITIAYPDGRTITGRVLAYNHDPESSNGMVYTRYWVKLTTGEFTGDHSTPIRFEKAEAVPATTDLDTASRAVKAVRELAIVGDDIADDDKREAFFHSLDTFIGLAEVSDNVRNRMLDAARQYSSGDTVEVEASPNGWVRATYVRAESGQHVVTVPYIDGDGASRDLPVHPEKIRPVPRGWDKV